MPAAQAVRPVLEQGEAVSAHEWDGCSNCCARLAGIIRVYREGVAVRGAGQLYAKRVLSEVCGELGQLHKLEEKQAVRDIPGPFPA